MDGGEGCTMWMYLINCTLINGHDNKFYVIYFTTKKAGT